MKNPLHGLKGHLTAVPSVTKLGKVEALTMLFDPEFYKESAKELVAGPWDRKPGEKRSGGGVTAVFDLKGARQSARRERRDADATTRRAEQKASQRDLHEAWREMSSSQRDLIKELKTQRTGKGGGGEE